MQVTRLEIRLASTQDGRPAVWNRHGDVIDVEVVDGVIRPKNDPNDKDPLTSFDDGTKFRVEALAFGRNPGGAEVPLKYEDYPEFLVGWVEFGAWSDDDSSNGSIGGDGKLVGTKRAENGVGCGGSLYAETNGANCAINLKRPAKYYTINATYHGPGAPEKFDSNSLRTAPVR